LPLRRDPPSGRDLDDGTVSQLFEEFRNVAAHRDPAVILIDQLKEIYIDATLKAIEDDQMVPDGHAQGVHPGVHRHRNRAR
jgi:hypothetical protein